MSHITSISLDPESARLAQRMKREGKNFSKFVRECLHLYSREDSDDHVGNQTRWYDCEPFCDPTRNHYCRTCWPTGAPALEHLAAARSHVGELVKARAGAGAEGVETRNLIDDLWERDGAGTIHMRLEPSVLEWLTKKADAHNQFIMPLADLELEGNAKPVKVEKPRKGLLKRIFSEIGR